MKPDSLAKWKMSAPIYYPHPSLVFHRPPAGMHEFDLAILATRDLQLESLVMEIVRSRYRYVSRDERRIEVYCC